MQQLLEWTLSAIRSENSDFSWMEEFRFDWVPPVKSAVARILEGQTVLVLTDSDREWFAHYIIGSINRPERHRPYVPFYPLEQIFPNLQEIESNQDLQLLEDMLEISFPGGYLLWYIGEGSHRYTKIAYRNETNFLWLLDEQVPGSFTLRRHDPLLDIKLLQLYRLFDRTVEAALFNEVALD